MRFKQWLAEVGMGGGGPGGGLAPPPQRPDFSGMADYHGEEGTDPSDQRGQLPPVQRAARKKKARNVDVRGPFSVAARGVSEANSSPNGDT